MFSSPYPGDQAHVLFHDYLSKACVYRLCAADRGTPPSSTTSRGIWKHSGWHRSLQVRRIQTTWDRMPHAARLGQLRLGFGQPGQVPAQGWGVGTLELDGL